MVNIAQNPADAQIKCAIFIDNNGEPGALLQETETLSSPVDIKANTAYWLAVWSDKGGWVNKPGVGMMNDAFAVKVTAEPGNGRYFKTAFGDWPDPMPPMQTNNVSYCLYIQ
jgi:hypothetical protein